MRKLMESEDLGKFANFPTLLLSSSEGILVSTLSTWLRPSPSIRWSSTSTRISVIMVGSGSGRRRRDRCEKSGGRTEEGRSFSASLGIHLSERDSSCFHSRPRSGPVQVLTHAKTFLIRDLKQFV